MLTKNIKINSFLQEYPKIFLCGGFRELIGGMLNLQKINLKILIK
jgi:hypothetical protein